MSVKYRMRFKLYTLVDITETKARRSDSILAQNQQQNYLTTLQTISLRANPIIEKLSYEDIDITEFDFGKDFTGVNRVWSLEFSFESADSSSIDFLKYDFDLVPIISNLTESVTFNISAFMTNGSPNRNIIFEER